MWNNSQLTNLIYISKVPYRKLLETSKKCQWPGWCRVKVLICYQTKLSISCTTFVVKLVVIINSLTLVQHHRDFPWQWQRQSDQWEIFSNIEKFSLESNWILLDDVLPHSKSKNDKSYRNPIHPIIYKSKGGVDSVYCSNKLSFMLVFSKNFFSSFFEVRYFSNHDLFLTEIICYSIY